MPKVSINIYKKNRASVVCCEDTSWPLSIWIYSKFRATLTFQYHDWCQSVRYKYDLMLHCIYMYIHIHTIFYNTSSLPCVAALQSKKPWVLMSGGFNLTHFILSVQMFPLLQPWSWMDTCCTRNQNSVYYRMTEPADLTTQTRVQKHTHAHTGKHIIHTKSHARAVFMRAVSWNHRVVWWRRVTCRPPLCVFQF